METRLAELYQALQKLITHHRQLLDAVRAEREALAQADLLSIQKSTYEKEAIVESIRLAEAIRTQVTAAIESFLGQTEGSLKLAVIVKESQRYDQRLSNDLQASYQTLIHLIDRITEQNQQNKELIERSLDHVRQMRDNVLVEGAPKVTTYSPQGTKRIPNASGARLISKEA